MTGIRYTGMVDGIALSEGTRAGTKAVTGYLPSGYNVTLLEGKNLEPEFQAAQKRIEELELNKTPFLVHFGEHITVEGVLG